MTVFRRTPKLRLLTTAAPFGLLAMISAPAFAQDTTPAPAATPDAQTAPADTQSDIVVTGTLFRGQVQTASPVTVLTSDTIEKAGITNVADAVCSVSADSAGSIGTGFQSGFSAGGAAISLRGVGVSSTVVLVDGLRSANFPLNDDGHNA
jgi:iron complex outermembrane recepter protein